MSQLSSDVHILLYFSIYFQEIFNELGEMSNDMHHMHSRFSVNMSTLSDLPELY